MTCDKADLGILGVHRILHYNDDTGYGMTECGLAIFPHETVFTDKPVWACNGCTPDSALIPPVIVVSEKSLEKLADLLNKEESSEGRKTNG